MSAPRAASHRWRSRNPLIAFRHAVEGIAHTFRTQRNMRIHLFTVVAILFAGLLLRLPRAEMTALVLSAALVMICEMFNTAIEAVVDMVTDHYHPAAKYAKDVAAGAVLISALTAAVVGGMVFFTYLRMDIAKSRMQDPPTITVAIAALLLLLVVVLLGKILGQSGSILRGGAISGHSAVAFFMATLIALAVRNVLVGVLALALAALVAQSRVEGKIHSSREVVVGAVLAVALCVIVYRLPPVLAGWMR